MYLIECCFTWEKPVLYYQTFGQIFWDNIPCLKYTDDDVVFSFNRLNNYCGKWIHHSGFYPDKKIRIWNRKIGKWEGIVHEVIKFSTKVKEVHLKGDLLHYSYAKPEDFEKQVFKFAELRAQHYFDKGKKCASLLKIISPIYFFIQHYFFRLGFLDGKEGFVMCKVAAKATRHKYETLEQLTINN